MNSRNIAIVGVAIVIVGACTTWGADEKPDAGKAAQSRVDAHAAVERTINWPSFLERNDPVWERLPKTWMEGAFIGNGRLGAMIYKVMALGRSLQRRETGDPRFKTPGGKDGDGQPK